MSNPWLRLYSEFADDPKVQTMPEHMQRRLIMLMCLRCKDETVDETLQAFHWRITPAEMAETKKLFIAKGFIDEDWDLLNWNRRQYISDSSTERVRQYRERKKRRETLHNPQNPDDFDKDVTGGNVTVTAPEQIQSRTETDSDAEHTQKASAPSAGKEAKKFAQSVRGMLSDLTDDSLGDLALEIACRHPRSRLRNWTPRNVGQADTVAILDAMEDEAQRTGVTMSEAGRMLLELLDAWDEVPREKWQYAAAIPKFYKQGDYRLEPKELPGVNPQEGKNHGKRRGTDGNAGALQEFLEGSDTTGEGDRVLDGGIGGGIREADQSENVSAVRRGARGTDSGSDRSGVQPGNGREPLLPKPVYPARIQWPRRNG